MLTIRNSLISVLLLLAIGLSTWSIFIANHSKQRAINDESNPPDAIMDNVVALILNKQGLPSLKVVTPQMVHHMDNDTTDIITPHVTIYRRSPNPWYINSDKAIASQGITQIIFSGNVVIHHLADTENPTTTMQTVALTVFPDKQTAETNQAVTIEQPDTVVHAIGMLANMNNGTVKLLSQAKGEYAPKT